MSASNRLRAARSRARRRGFHIVRDGSALRLCDGAGKTVITGDLDVVEAYLAPLFLAPRPQRVPWGTAQPPAEWTQIVNDYLLTQAAAGRPQTTMELRRLHLVQMAHGLGAAPANVTAEQLVAWFGSSHPEWAIETRRSYRTTIRGFWRWAYRTKRVPEHLADELPVVREHRGAPRPAPDTAWRAALAAADARVTLMLRLAAEAGLRRGEVAKVQTRDLMDGVDGAQLLVHGKGNKERVVPISDSLADLIRAGAAGHTPGSPATGWLFPNGRGSHLNVRYVGELVSGVLPDHWTMHALRHRMASRAYRGTRNLRAVQQLLGHSNLAVTERYVAVDDSEMRAAMMAAVGGESW